MATRDDIPGSSRLELKVLGREIRNAYKSGAGLRHPCYDFYPVECSGAPLAALIHRSYVISFSTNDVEEAIGYHAGSGDFINADNPMTPTLDWYPAYDLLLQNAWYEELHKTNISIR